MSKTTPPTSSPQPDPPDFRVNTLEGEVVGWLKTGEDHVPYDPAADQADGYARSYHLHICRTFPQLYDMKDDVVRLETARDILLRVGKCEDWLARTRLRKTRG
jgi:hypothetical protein